MADMKKHQFLQTEWQSTVKLTPAERKKIGQWLEHASWVLEKLSQEGLFPKRHARSIKVIRVSLLICGDTRIKTLNLAHRKKAKITDVLSFPAHEDLRQKVPQEVVPAGELFIGDLAICFPQTKRQANRFKIGIWDEFIHLFLHGLLHLIGFDHEVSVQEEKIMQAWEDRALELFSKRKKGA